MKYSLLSNRDYNTDNFVLFHFFNCVSTGGEKVVSILDIHLPELELEVELELELVNN